MYNADYDLPRRPLTTKIDDANANRQRPLVIYHSPCLDGFTAAWAMWLKYPDAEFVPGVYGQDPPDCAGREVYLLDFSYKHDVMMQMLNSMGQRADGSDCALTILDHHKSAQSDLKPFFDGSYSDEFAGRLRGKFDMNHSGARLAWDWFHTHERVPLMIGLVEDRDLWKFEMPNSKALNALLFSYDYDFDVWSGLSEVIEDEKLYVSAVKVGEAIERKHMKDVRELVEKLRFNIKFDDLIPSRVMPCANLPYTYASDAAGLMAETAPFAATYFFDGKDYVFSLRSRGEGGEDVSEVAQHYGGGGHRSAAGFRVKSLEEL